MKQSRSYFVMASVLLVLAALPAVAQITGGDVGLKLEFSSPTAFYVQNTKLPPGAYTVSQLGVGQPNVLVVRSVKPGHEVLVEVSQMPSPNQKPAHSQVVFNKYGNNDVLNQIWFVDTKSGSHTAYEVTSSMNEKMQSGSPTQHSTAAK